VKVDDFKPKAGDLLHQPGEGGRVGQLGTQGGRVWPVVTLQSSNCAHSVLSARPVKVISYVFGRTGLRLAVGG
jgi:hypothetical protein